MPGSRASTGRDMIRDRVPPMSDRQPPRKLVMVVTSIKLWRTQAHPPTPSRGFDLAPRGPLDTPEYRHPYGNQRHGEEQGQQRVAGHQRPYLTHERGHCVHAGKHGIKAGYSGLNNPSFKRLMDAGPRIERGFAGSEPAVLPLHQPAIFVTHPAAVPEADQRELPPGMCYKPNALYSSTIASYLGLRRTGRFSSFSRNTERPLAFM